MRISKTIILSQRNTNLWWNNRWFFPIRSSTFLSSRILKILLFHPNKQRKRLMKHRSTNNYQNRRNKRHKRSIKNTPYNQISKRTTMRRWNASKRENKKNNAINNNNWVSNSPKRTLKMCNLMKSQARTSLLKLLYLKLWIVHPSISCFCKFWPSSMRWNKKFKRSKFRSRKMSSISWNSKRRRPFLTNSCIIWPAS